MAKIEVVIDADQVPSRARLFIEAGGTSEIDGWGGRQPEGDGRGKADPPELRAHLGTIDEATRRLATPRQSESAQSLPPSASRKRRPGEGNRS